MRRNRFWLILLATQIYSAHWAMARTMIEVEHRTSKGCKVVWHVEANKLEEKKVERLEWTGACKGGYAEGEGTVTMRLDDGMAIKTVVAFHLGREEGRGTSEASYADGRKVYYAGQFSRGLPNGSGDFTADNGKGEITKYKGDFVDGLPEGKGRMETPKWSYAGDFREMKPFGMGRFDYPNKVVYEGEVRDGKPDGQGKLRFVNGVTVGGYFSEGKSPKSGRTEFPSGAVYEGELNNSSPWGKGRITYPDRTVYIGEFKNGLPDGEGIAVSADGKRLNVTAEKGKFSRRLDATERAEIDRLDDQRRQEELRTVEAKEAQESRARACYWAMLNRPNNGTSSGAMANAAKCETDPNADLKPLPPSYVCSRDQSGHVYCNPN